jgi:hypothetical protein
MTRNAKQTERYLRHIAKTKAKPLASAKKVLEAASKLMTSLPVPEPSPIQIVQPHELKPTVERMTATTAPVDMRAG